MGLAQTEVAYNILALINDIGEPVTFRQLNTSSGVHPTTAELDYSVLGVTQTFSIRDMHGTLIKSNQRTVLMLAIDTTSNAIPTPMVNDRLTIGGTLHTITSVQPVLSQGGAVAYRLIAQ